MLHICICTSTQNSLSINSEQHHFVLCKKKAFQQNEMQKKMFYGFEEPNYETISYKYLWKTL